MSGNGDFDTRERVVHKLAGAAFQMTFAREYDMAVETMEQAAEFWEATEQPMTDGGRCLKHSNEIPCRLWKHGIPSGRGDD